MSKRTVTADPEGTKSRSTDEPFPDYVAALEYAYWHGLELVCAGGAAFKKWQRKLPAGAFEVHTYGSKDGIKTCGMFLRQFRRVEFLFRPRAGSLADYVRNRTGVVDEPVASAQGRSASVDIRITRQRGRAVT